MSEFVTVHKSDSQYMQLLRGQLKGQRAIPIKTLNPNTQVEVTTFKLVPKSSLVRPPIWWWYTLRGQRLWVPLFPLLFMAIEYQSVWTPLTLWSVIGVASLCISAFLFNDYFDHISGIDRIQSSRGEKPIQNGWVSALSVWRGAWLALTVAVISALAVFYLYPSWVLLWAGLAGTISFYIISKRRFGATPGFRETGLFLIFGPLLASGYEFALTSKVSEFALGFGAIWGWLVVHDLLTKHFAEDMFQQQTGTRTVLSVLGFERGQQLLLASYAVAIIGVALFAVLLSRFEFLIVEGPLVVALARLSWRLQTIQSPVSSSMAALKKESLFVLALVALFFLGAKGLALWL